MIDATFCDFYWMSLHSASGSEDEKLRVKESDLDRFKSAFKDGSLAVELGSFLKERGVKLEGEEMERAVSDANLKSLESVEDVQSVIKRWNSIKGSGAAVDATGVSLVEMEKDVEAGEGGAAGGASIEMTKVGGGVSIRGDDGKVPWHFLDPDVVVSKLSTNEMNGLAKDEAASRLQRDGPNTITAAAGRTLLEMIWQNFNSVVTYILLGSAVIAGVFEHWPDFGMILLVVVVNVVLGVIQEGRAEEATKAISRMTSTVALVVRNGRQSEVDASSLVAGDIVKVAAGDRVPADVRWLETSQLRVNEAPLTGESAPVTKSVLAVPRSSVLADRTSMGFSGTLVFTGQGTGVVVETGDDAAIGAINKMVSTASNVRTPLLASMDRLGLQLSAACLVFSVVTFFVAYFGREISLTRSLLLAISVAVALIPEGLGIVVTITLSAGVRAMAARRAIVRQLPAVETLGSVSVICSDKTGTLTRNEMTVVGIHAPGRHFRVTGAGYHPDGEVKLGSGETAPEADLEKLHNLLLPAVLCNDATLAPDMSEEAHRLIAAQRVNLKFLPAPEPEHHAVWPRRITWSCTGDPTEAALVAGAMKAGLNLRTLNLLWRACPRIATLPFSSESKFMATLHDIPTDESPPEAVLEVAKSAVPDKKEMPSPVTPSAEAPPPSIARRVLMIKGAPEVLLPLCTAQAADLDPWTTEEFDRQKWMETAASLSGEGLRVLALAHLYLPMDDPDPVLNTDLVLHHREGLTFHCLMSIIDPPRDDAIKAIEVCKDAGISVRMITGDHIDTARTIAGWMGIPNELVLSGAQLDQMSDEEAMEKVKKTCVFARTTPEHKLRIVGMLQAHRHIVAMTGDGVNDAPALKKADVGVAMGESGTDVAKEASKIILTDDNFSTIVAAVRQGRGVYSNIVKQLYFLLPTSAAQGLSIFFAIAIGIDAPLTAIQVLWVNMITAATLGLVIGVEDPEPGVMSRKPRKPNSQLLDANVLLRAGLISLIMIASVLGNAAWTRSYDPDNDQRAYTVAMNTLVFSQALYCLSCRFERTPSLSVQALITNPWLTAMVLLNAGLQCIITYTPAIEDVADTAPIDGFEWLRILAFALIVFTVGELQKYFSYLCDPHEYVEEGPQDEDESETMPRVVSWRKSRHSDQASVRVANKP